MTTTLITGSNKGLGREAARRLIAAGHDVWVAARDPQRGEQAANDLGARFVQLDVTDDASVAAAVAQVEATSARLDVLVNNAGIAGSLTITVPETTVADVEHVYAAKFNGNSGPQTVEQGTDAIVALASIGPDGPTGTYRDRAGALGW